MNAVRRYAYESLSRDAAPWCTPLFREVVLLVLTYADLKGYEDGDGVVEWQWEFHMGPTDVANRIGRSKSNGIRSDVRKAFEALMEIGLMRLTFRARGPLAATYEVRPSFDIPWEEAGAILGGLRKYKADATRKSMAKKETSQEVSKETSQETETSQEVSADSAPNLETSQEVSKRPPERSVRDLSGGRSLPIGVLVTGEMAEVVETPSPQDARDEPLPDVDAYLQEIRAAMKARPLQQLQSARRQLGRIGQDAGP
jgi:hypothetical protein